MQGKPSYLAFDLPAWRGKVNPEEVLRKARQQVAPTVKQVLDQIQAILVLKVIGGQLIADPFVIKKSDIGEMSDFELKEVERRLSLDWEVTTSSQEITLVAKVIPPAPPPPSPSRKNGDAVLKQLLMQMEEFDA